MKKTLEIESSKYSIEYEEGKEWIYSVKRCGVDTGNDLKTNIVSDMFQMILNLQADTGEFIIQSSDHKRWESVTCFFR